jgi:phage terminase large subunit GpA-like protein
MDAITDPTVTFVSVMKSARVGYTLMVSAAIGYHIHQSPAPIMLVQPTVEDAEEFSKDTIAPMLRDVPVLASIIYEDVKEKGPKASGNTISSKRFPGGVLQMIGANSGRGFRRVSRKVVIFDEVDAYPPSAGNDGDPIELGTKRAEYYWDRKILAGSTPLIAGASRIERKFNEGDQRRFYVPCPHCDHFDHLVFSKKESRRRALHAVARGPA